MSEITKLKGDSKGGFLDSLLNKNQLPDVNVTLSKETLINLGVMLVVSVSILLLLNFILKQMLK